MLLRWVKLIFSGKMSETKTLVEGDAWITCPKCQSEFEQAVSIEVDPNDVKASSK